MNPYLYFWTAHLDRFGFRTFEHWTEDTKDIDLYRVTELVLFWNGILIKEKN